MRKINYLILAVFVAACIFNSKKSDAYGYFEADEYFVCAETQGRIISSEIVEGKEFMAGDVVAVLDTASIKLQMKELEASLSSLKVEMLRAEKNIAFVQEKLNVMSAEKARILNLFSSGAATGQQRDDISGKVSMTQKELEVAKVAPASIRAQVNSLKVKL